MELSLGKVAVNLQSHYRQWSFESEYMDLTEATKDWNGSEPFLRNSDIRNDKSNSDPTDLFSDNQGAIALAKNPVSHARAKHIDIRHHFVREAIDDKIIWVQYIPTTEMTAASLTNAFGREKRKKCTARMVLTSVGVPLNSIFIFILLWIQLRGKR